MGLSELRAAQRAAADKNAKNGDMFVFASKHVKCTRCGIVPKNATAQFFKRTASPLYAGQDGFICVCKSCANQIFEEYVEETDGDILLGIQQFCCTFNYYYDKDIAIELVDNGIFTISKYLQKIARLHHNKTFVDNFSAMNPSVRQEVVETYDRTAKWNIEDRQNMNHVVSMLGYDPFSDGGYTDDQLRFLYNTSAGYLTDGIEQDPHKLQNIILLVKTFLQLETIDKQINAQFNAIKPDTNLIASLTTMKEKLTTTTTRIANENGFSEKTSGKTSQGSNTLSHKMKDMIDANFVFSKVNIHDIRMSESFKEIAAINAHALIEEMNLTGDDYARMCAEQREFLSELQNEKGKLEEANRLLNIRIKDLENQIRRTSKK